MLFVQQCTYMHSTARVCLDSDIQCLSLVSLFFYALIFSRLNHKSQLATEFSYSGCFFANCNSFLQTIPPSLKTECPQKRKPVLTRSTLQTFCPQASCLSFWWCLSKNMVGAVYTFDCFNRTLEKLFVWTRFKKTMI